MQIMTNPDTIKELEIMRNKWKKGRISVKEYHDFIEHTKHSIKVNDEVHRFF